MTYNNRRRFTPFSIGLLGLLACMFSTSALSGGGGTVELTHETGAPGGTVIVTFTFTNTADASALEGNAFISDPSAFTSIDLNCGGAGDFAQCVHRDDIDALRFVVTNFDPTNAINDFTVEIEMDIALGAALGDVILLEWDTADPEFTPDLAIDGSVTIAEVVGNCGLLIDPLSHDFGSVQVGDSASQAFTVSNNGDGDCTGVGVAVSGAEFSLDSDDCPAILAPGEDCTANVSFAPGSEGNFNGSLDATSNEDSESAALSGTGTEDPVLECDIAIAPASHNFGNVIVGQTASTSFTVSSTGDDDCTVDGITVAGDSVFSGPGTGSCALGTTLEPGSNCTVVVECTPDAEGSFSGSLTVSANPEVTAALSCTGFVQVLPDFVPIPTLQAWGVALMALLMLLIGVVGVRSFRT